MVRSQIEAPEPKIEQPEFEVGLGQLRVQSDGAVEGCGSLHLPDPRHLRELARPFALDGVAELPIGCPRSRYELASVGFSTTARRAARIAA